MPNEKSDLDERDAWETAGGGSRGGDFQGARGLHGGCASPRERPPGDERVPHGEQPPGGERAEVGAGASGGERAAHGAGASGGVRDRPVRVTLTDDGPMLVEGPVEVSLPDGRVVRSDRFTAAVCLCGRSARHPWCDTSHRRRPPKARRAAERRSQRDAGPRSERDAE